LNEELISTIESASKECTSHLERLYDSEIYLQELRPFTATKLESIGKEQVLHLDQFIYRFTKFQDSMARRLLPSLYALLEADTEPKPFLDILGRLEQLNVISSVATWQQFRNLRNNLAHDYPESLQQTADTLNELLDTWHDLESIFRMANDAYHRRKSDDA
jgi:hypothetical protein